MKYFALLLLQLCWTAAFASDQEGYIINTNGDTVKGKVDVELKKIVFGKKDLDLGEMEKVISFSENGGKFKKVYPADIAGYGFSFNDVWYHFVVLDWNKNTWKKNQSAFERKIKNLEVFIHRAMEGAVTVYKDYYKEVTTMIGMSNSKTEKLVTELYILTSDLGFVEVAPATFGGNKKLKEFLIKYLSLEDEFLKMVEDKAKFSDAEEVLRSYNDWKRTN